MGYSPKQTTWLNPNIEYLFDTDITEWDIQDAGFSLIKQFNLLSEEEIKRLTKLEKGKPRHIEVGKLQRDNKEFAEALNNAFAEARKIFIQTNNLSDDNIISVKKDAIFTTGNINRVKFGQVIFSPKHTYSSYLRFSNIHNVEIYYSDQGMDFKQINDDVIKRHRIYTVEFLKKFIQKMESKDPSIKRFMMNYIMNYKSLEMDEEYYLEFNNKSNNINPLFNYREIILPLLSIINKEIS